MTHTFQNEHNYSTTASYTTLFYSLSFQATSNIATFQTEAIYIGDHASITTIHDLTCAITVVNVQETILNTGCQHILNTVTNVSLGLLEYTLPQTYVADCVYVVTNTKPPPW
jgi:hypothetical protein